MAKRRKTFPLKEALLFWETYNGDTSDEDEEEDALAGFQTLNKRPKWMTSAYTSKTKTSNINMATDGTKPNPCLSRGVSSVRVPIKRNLNPEIKENGADVVEIIEIEDNGLTPVEERSPLSDLAVRPKSKSLPTGAIYNGTVSRLNQRNHIREKKQNGVQPTLFNTFTSPVRLSKPSTPRQTAVSETFKICERRTYSQLLADCHKSARSTSMIPGPHQTSQRSSVDDILKSTPSSQTVEWVDLTSDDKKKTCVTVKQWQNSTANSEDDDLKIIEERPITRVNSLEKRLSQNCLVSPRWIQDMQNKYSERERESLRQVEEEKLKKELYAQHNQAKRIEALDERIRRHLKLTDVVLDDTGETALPELTPEMREKIGFALKPNPSSEVLVEGFGQQITRHDIQTLNRLNWLNDEVINFYMNLLIERGKEEKNLRIYAFNTFFYPKLVSQGYSSLKRWTKKVDIFAQDMLLVPIHLGMHWCMATMDFRNKRVHYYDSMGSENTRCLLALLQYLTEESLDKKKKPYDTSGWVTENVKNIPQQMNGSDCGMFSCMFAEYLSRNAKITFSQKDMPYFRQKMVYEIISKKLLQ